MSRLREYRRILLDGNPVDVVRLGYADLIGTDRGRDLLVNRLARTANSGVGVLPFGLRHRRAELLSTPV
jgi:hypothetical protein